MRRVSIILGLVCGAIAVGSAGSALVVGTYRAWTIAGYDPGFDMMFQLVLTSLSATFFAVVCGAIVAFEDLTRE